MTVLSPTGSSLQQKLVCLWLQTWSYMLDRICMVSDSGIPLALPCVQGLPTAGCRHGIQAPPQCCAMSDHDGNE